MHQAKLVLSFWISVLFLGWCGYETCFCVFGMCPADVLIFVEDLIKELQI